MYYTGYKKHHGVKVSIICCILSGFILDVVFTKQMQLYKIANGAQLLGDKAYHEGISCVNSPIKEDFMGAYRLKVKQNVTGANKLLTELEAYNKALGQ